MMAYSMTKFVTAVATLRLVEEGRLDLDAPASSYMPELPYGDSLRVRHLLSQSAGVPNPIPLRWVHGADEHASFDSRARLHELLRQYPRLNFTPGSRYAYSNLSYWILGEIITTVAGMPFSTYVEQNIFRRLGVSAEDATFVHPPFKPRADGYLYRFSMLNLLKPLVTDKAFWGGYEDNWLRIKPHYPDSPSMGGLLTNALTLGKLLHSLLAGDKRVLHARGTGLLFGRQTDNRGRPLPMTLGLHVNTHKGFLYKEGGGAGFHSELRIYPKANTAEVVMANSTGFHVKSFLNALRS